MICEAAWKKWHLSVTTGNTWNEWNYEWFFFLCYSLILYKFLSLFSFFVICIHLLWKQMSYICPKKGLDPCLKRAFYCDTLLSSARIVQSSWTFWWMITTQWDLSVLIYEVCMIVNAWRRYTWRVSRSICVRVSCIGQPFHNVCPQIYITFRRWWTINVGKERCWEWMPDARERWINTLLQYFWCIVCKLFRCVIRFQTTNNTRKHGTVGQCSHRSMCSLRNC